jgi:hypothetical protein
MSGKTLKAWCAENNINLSTIRIGLEIREVENMEFSEKDLIEIKEEYRKLYHKSKEYDISSEQRSELLDKLIEDIYVGRINQFRDVGEIFTDSEKNDILSKLKIFMSKWRKEFEKESSKNTFWKFLNREK